MKTMWSWMRTVWLVSWIVTIRFIDGIKDKWRNRKRKAVRQIEDRPEPILIRDLMTEIQPMTNSIQEHFTAISFNPHTNEYQNVPLPTQANELVYNHNTDEYIPRVGRSVPLETINQNARNIAGVGIDDINAILSSLPEPGLLGTSHHKEMTVSMGSIPCDLALDLPCTICNEYECKHLNNQTTNPCKEVNLSPQQMSILLDD